MARQHKRDTRIPLPQVDLGNAVAESDGHLAEYYYDNEYYQSAKSLTDRHVFFVGGKGSGKSAILTMVEKSISGPKIIRLGADDIGMGLLSNTNLVEGLGAVDLGIIYKAIWDYLILINIVKAEFGTTKPPWWNVLVPKEEREVFDLLDKTGELEEGSMKLGRAFVSILKRLQLRISAGGFKFEARQ